MKQPETLPLAPRSKDLDLVQIAPGVLGYDALVKSQELLALNGLKKRRDTRIELTKAIRQTRQSVANLSDTNKAEFSVITNRLVSAEQDRGNPPSPVQDKVDWAGWLESDASDDEVLKFCAWNAYRLYRAQQQPYFRTGIEDVKWQYREGLLAGINFNAVDPTAEERLSDVDGVKVMLSDYVDLGAQGRDGYTSHNSDRVYIDEPRSEWLSHDDSRIIRHEIGHAVLGRFDDSFRDEVFTEHFAHALDNDRWFQLDPRIHALAGSYRNCRDLANAIWPRSDQVRLLTLIYSAQTEAARERHKHRLRKLQSDGKSSLVGRVVALMQHAEIIGEIYGVPYYSAIEVGAKVLLAVNGSLRPELRARDKESGRALTATINEAVRSLSPRASAREHDSSAKV